MSLIVNSLGLTCDIIGAVLIFLYGLPPVLNRQGHSFLTLEGQDDAMKRTAERCDSLSRIGLFLLIGGFGLQLMSNFLK